MLSAQFVLLYKPCKPKPKPMTLTLNSQVKTWYLPLSDPKIVQLPQKSNSIVEL